MSEIPSSSVSSNSKLKFTKDTVIKSGDPNLLRVEVEKTLRAREIAEDSGIFRVPRVVDFDAAEGKIVFERINRLLSIRTLLANGKRLTRLLTNWHMR